MSKGSKEKRDDAEDKSPGKRPNKGGRAKISTPLKKRRRKGLEHERAKSRRNLRVSRETFACVHLPLSACTSTRHGSRELRTFRTFILTQPALACVQHALFDDAELFEAL